MSRCRSCGAEIRWIKMSSGKSMPVDPDQVPYWARPGATGKVVTSGGESSKLRIHWRSKNG